MRNFTAFKMCSLAVLLVVISGWMLYMGQKWPATLPAGAALWCFFLAYRVWRGK